MSDAILRFVGTDEGLGAQFKRANDSLKTLENNASKTTSLLGKGFSSVAGVLAGISFVRIAHEAFELAEQLEIASARTGIAIESIQRLQFVATQSETSFEAITSSINKFQVNLVEGNDKATAALKRLGISVGELNSLRPEEQFIRIAEAVADIQSPAERAATAIELFGRGGAQLLPLLSKGADAIKDLDVQFDKFGVTLSTDTVHAVDDAGDAISRMGTSVKSLGVELLSLASPALVAASDSITTFFKAVAFGVRGEGGGHGDNAIANITRDIELLQSRIKFLNGEGGAHNSKLFGNDLNTVIALNAQVDGLTRRLEVLTGTGVSGINPLQKLGVDSSLVQIAKDAQKSLAAIDLGPPALSVDEQRRQALRNNNPAIVNSAVEEKDLLLKINQDKLDELLRQDTKYSTDRVAVFQSSSDRMLDITEALVGRTIDLERFKANFSQDANLATAELAGQVASNVFEDNKGFQIASATISAISGASRALADFPYPYSIAVAGLVLAQGFANVQRIRSTHKGGGSSGASISGGGSVSSRDSGSAASNFGAPVQPGATQRKVANITIIGRLPKGDLQSLIQQIKDELSDTDIVLN